MGETFDCNDKVSDVDVPCLDRSQIEQAIEVLREIRTKVNEFRSKEGDPPIDDIDVTELSMSPAPLSARLFKTLGDYVKTLIDTGRVVKLTKDEDGNYWTMPPEDAADITKLEECGSFWGSWNEAYDCLGFDSTLRTKAFGPSQTLPFYIDKKIWNEFWVSIHCLLPSSPCFPDCQCPVCEKGGGLPPEGATLCSLTYQPVYPMCPPVTGCLDPCWVPAGPPPVPPYYECLDYSSWCGPTAPGYTMRNIFGPVMMLGILVAWYVDDPPPIPPGKTGYQKCTEECLTLPLP